MKTNRSLLGSRFSKPWCPGASTYQSDEKDGGKECKGLMGLFKIDKDGVCASDTGCSLAVTGPACPGVSRGIMDRKGGGRKCKGIMGDEFEIDKDGHCDSDQGCSLAVSGPICPGVSIGIRDLKGGNRECKIPELPGQNKNKPFEINKKGECVDPNNCATSLTDAIKFACPISYEKDPDHVIPSEWAKKGAVHACKGEGLAEAYLDKDGKQILGKKTSSRKKSMCYMRKQKGRTLKKRICLNESAVARLRRGARKGGLHSHK